MIAKETIFETGTGVSIKDAASQAIDIAKQENEQITFIYNSIKIPARPDSSPKNVMNMFFSQAMSQSNIGILPTLKTRGA